MRKKIVGFALSFFGALLLGLSFPAEAQQTKKLPRIGYLSAQSLTAPHQPPRVDGFRQGLRELGYIEGKNVAIDYRWAEGKFDRLPELAAELVRIKVDVIVTAGDASIRAAKEATGTIPIVVGVAGDLVTPGYVVSHARPGGNITGLIDTSPDLGTKRLELLKEAFPKVSRVAVIWNPTNPVKVLDFKETKIAAQSLGLQIQSLEVRNANGFEPAFSAIKKERAGALLILPDSLMNFHQSQIVDFVSKNRVPAIGAEGSFADAGGLMVYGPSFPDMFRRAAYFVDKILKGTKPADLPVEQPTKFELIMNLKTAKQIGVTIPPNVLARADRVIK